MLICALGCGQALKDSGSGIRVHADEVPFIFVSWLSLAFVLRVRLWRTCHPRRQNTTGQAAILRVRCATLKCVTLEVFSQQRPYSLKPIDFASWTEKHSMPRVLEPKRPGKSDPHDAVMLLIWWLHSARLRALNIAIVAPFEQQDAPEPRSVAT